MHGSRVRQFTVSTPDGALLRVRDFPAAEASEPTGPTVVLAHGWTLTHASWLPVIERLQAHRNVRVLAYDQRAHGDSTPGTEPASVRLLGQDLAAVLEVGVPTGPLVLGGHSMGGMTLLAYAGQHAPEFTSRVRGVALVSTAAGELSGRGRRAEALAMRAFARAPGIKAGRAITMRGQRKLLFGDAARPEDVRATRDQVAATTLPTLGRYHAALGAHDEIEATAHFAGVPASILVGERDRLTPVRLAKRLAELIPHAELHVLPGRGHMLTYEDSDLVTQTLATFVDREA